MARRLVVVHTVRDTGRSNRRSNRCPATYRPTIVLSRASCCMAAHLTVAVGGPNGRVVVWTGTEFIVAGGTRDDEAAPGEDAQAFNSDGVQIKVTNFADGAAYNPVTDTWRSSRRHRRMGWPMMRFGRAA